MSGLVVARPVKCGRNMWRVVDRDGAVFGTVSLYLFRYRFVADQNGLSPARGDAVSLEAAVEQVCDAYLQSHRDG